MCHALAHVLIVFNSFHQPKNFCSYRLPKRVVFAKQSLTEFEQYKTSNTAGVLLGATIKYITYLL